MEHQYPVAITGDEHMLAELMLPDQAHVRNQDWTIFFLHKDTSQEEEEAEEKEEKRRRRQMRKDKAAGDLNSEDDTNEEGGKEEEDAEEEDLDSEPGGEGSPLIYVLNLVNTKQDKTAKRGAVVKAMAICTRHPFLHIYKVGLRRFRGSLLNFSASFVTSPRRVLQITTSFNFGTALRGRKYNGSIIIAKAESARKVSFTGERQ